MSYNLEDLMRSPTTEEVNEAVENLDDILSKRYYNHRRNRKSNKSLKN